MIIEHSDKVMHPRSVGQELGLLWSSTGGITEVAAEITVNTEGPLVYIVDDDASIRRAMKRFINSAGLSVKTFSSARSFLDYESISTHACIIADVKMPEIGGIELVRELRHRGCRLPVIIVTAFDNEETRELAHKAGVAGYFRKPVDAHALLDAVFWASYEAYA